MRYFHLAFSSLFATAALTFIPPAFAGYGIGGNARTIAVKELPADFPLSSILKSNSVRNNLQSNSRQVSPRCERENLTGGVKITCTSGGVTVACIYPSNGGSAQCTKLETGGAVLQD
jgi:hypothetical protein